VDPPPQQATKDQRGTEQFPIFVKTVPTPQSQEELERERKNQQENTPINNRIANFTKLLVIVGVLQFATFIAQAIILSISLIATKKAADAAKQSAEVAAKNSEVIPTIERAYVFVEVDFSQEFIPDRGITEFIAKIGIANRGKTPALLLDCSYIAKVVGLNEELPEISKMEIPSPWIPAGTVVIGADDKRIVPATIQTNAVEMKSVEAYTDRLVCYGVIRYEDVFRKSHETGFCWEYQDRVKDFYPAKDHERNYRT